MRDDAREPEQRAEPSGVEMPPRPDGVQAPRPDEAPLPPGETPLGKSERLKLQVATAGLVVLFYLVAVSGLVLLSLYVVVLFVLMIGAARFGLHLWVYERLKVQKDLLVWLARGLRLAREESTDILLDQREAPGLHAIASEAAARVGLAPPDEIRMDLIHNASVELRGYRQGRGHCILRVGLELLATTSVAELSAIVAHEMAHAQLIERGFRGLVGRALSRMFRTVHQLRGVLFAAEAEEKRYYTAEMLFAVLRPLAVKASRLLATYSRQHEFAADAGAAMQAGAAFYARTLSTIVVTGVKAGRLSWQEELSHLHTEKSFTAWLRARLAPTAEEWEELEAEAIRGDHRSEFSTHPTLRDRIAAVLTLPETGQPPPGGEGSALTLLADADRRARRLMEFYERRSQESEEKHSQHLRRELSKGGPYGLRNQQNRYWLMGLGAWLFVQAIMLYGALHPRTDPSDRGIFRLVFFVLLPVGIGLLIWRLYREKKPEYEWVLPDAEAFICAARQDDPVEDEADVETGIRAALSGGSLQPLKASPDELTQRCRSALRASDLGGALIDGILTVRTARDSFYGMAARAVGSARHQHSGISQIAMGELVQRHYRSDAVLPYLGWAMLLEGEGEAAEMYLREAIRLRPADFTLQVMLGWVLLGMQKSQSAVSHASRLLHQHPESGVARLLAAYAYHESARAREALDLFASVPEGPLRGRRYWLEVAESARLLNRTDLVEEAVAKLRGERFDIRVWCSLGGEALNAGRLDEARRWFEEALEHGHYPEALHGLLFVSVRENRNEDADRIASRMLSLEAVRPHDAAHPMSLLPAVVGIISSLQPPLDDAQTFISRYPLAAELPTPVDLEWMELMIAARTQAEAEDYGRWLWRALFPSHPVPPAQIKPAAGHQQSDGATYPGIVGKRFISREEK